MLFINSIIVYNPYLLNLRENTFTKCENVHFPFTVWNKDPVNRLSFCLMLNNHFN